MHITSATITYMDKTAKHHATWMFPLQKQAVFLNERQTRPSELRVSYR